jgi:hypothetical protein
VSEPRDLRWGIQRERTLARIAVAFIGALSVVHLLSVIFQLERLGVLTKIRSQTPGILTAAQASDARIAVTGVAALLFMIPSVVMFLMWLFAAYRNLSLVGSKDADDTPGWAVGYFFIPFLNLYKPYVIVKELSLRSADGNVPVSREEGERGPALVAIWWIAFLFSGIVSEIGVLASAGNKGLDRLEWATQMLVAGNGRRVLAGGLVIAVILSIDRKQALFREPQPVPAAVSYGL